MSGITTGTAVLISAGIAASAAVYSAEEAKKSQKKATAAREQAAATERARLAAINANKRPDQESANVEFGKEDSGDVGSTYDDFLVNPTTSASKLGASGGASLGSTGVSSLGMK